MTKIVKSAMVVDDRSGGGASAMEAIAVGQTILKRQIVEGGAVVHPPAPPSKTSYLDELNRLKMELSKAKDELQDMSRRLNEAKAECEAKDAHMENTAELRKEAETAAAAIVKNAKADAGKILSGARAEADKLAEEAKNNGYLEGFSKGFEEARQEFKSRNDPLNERIDRILEELADYRQEQIRKNEQELIALVIAATRKIITNTLEADAGAVADILRGIAGQNSQEEYIRISLSPDLAPVTAKAGRDIKKLIAGLGANVSVITDPNLEEGGIYVETPGGIVDVSIQTQLNNLNGIMMGSI